MKKRITALIMAVVIAFALLPTSALAQSGASSDFGDSFSLRFDGLLWKAYVLEDVDDTITTDELNITLTNNLGQPVPEDAYDIVVGVETDWDYETDSPVIDPIEGELSIPEELREDGFCAFGAYAVAKEGSGYTGQSVCMEFMLWHRYSFNWFGGSISFGKEYLKPSRWYWHDYYKIPVGEIKTPTVFDIADNPLDPSTYTVTYYERNTDIPDQDDPDYEEKIYPLDNPLRGMPETPGSYFACAEPEEPYYGTAWVDFDIVGEAQIDLSDGCEMRYDGKNWKAYILDDIDDALTLDELNITVADKIGKTVPESDYDLVVGIVDGFDEEAGIPIIVPKEGPYGIPDDEIARAEGLCSYGAYAVAKEGGSATGRVRPQSFIIIHRYSLNYIGCNATFGEEFKKEKTWSWHDYFEIPADKIHEPEVYNAAGELVDPGQYTITYFKRNISAPTPPPADGEVKGYPEDDPMTELPDQPGKYFARINGKAPYYGTGYVDFDIVGEGEEKSDLSDGYTMLFNGEEWGDYLLDSRSDTITAEELNITVVRGGEVVPEDAYELRFSVVTGYDDEAQAPILTEVESPLGLSVLPEAAERGWLMHTVRAVAKSDGDYTGSTSDYEFMIADRHTLDRNFATIDFGEKYLVQRYISWHYTYSIPASEIHEPTVRDFTGNTLDPSMYTLTYFERGEFDESDPSSRDNIYNEDKPLSGLPVAPGEYFVRLDGKGDYYGTCYTDFDIEAVPESYVVPYGSETRYYDGYTVYMKSGETLKLRFEIEPREDDLIVGWVPEGLEEAGFELRYDPEFIDGVMYAVISSGNAADGAHGAIVYNWYKRSDVFDDQGGAHWNTAVPAYTAAVNITINNDREPNILGDADGSGEVDAVDATVIQRYVLGFELPHPLNVLMLGDIDGDGELTIVDATFIQRYATHIAVPYPIGKVKATLI